MDVLTQGLLGAAVAQSGSKQSETKIATLVGFLTGMLADADVLIRSAEDSLLTIEYHRHFTHSLAFIPLGALIAALLLWPFLRKKLGFKVLYFYAFLGYMFSGVLDAFTSYGTHLYWPFSDERVSWHLISIIDPIFTLVLLVSILVGLRIKNAKAARTGLVLCSLYLVLGAIQLNRVEQFTYNLAQQRGHTIKQLVSKPTLGNLFLWRSTYINDDTIHVDGIRAGFNGIKHYPGNSVKKLNLSELENRLPVDSVLYNDIKRFNFFSDDYLAWYPGKQNVIGDMRYALLPDSTMPLWGIEFDLDQSDKHAHFVAFRVNNAQNRERFFNMVKGMDVPLINP